MNARRILGISSVLCGLGAPAWLAAAAMPELPPPATILSQVVARLPRQPILVAGTLEKAGAASDDARTFNVEMYFCYGRDPAVARYTVRDAFGTDLEQLQIERTPQRTPRFRYEKGSPLAAAPTPDLSAAVQGTDVRWADLALSFLWWPGGQTAGREVYKGQSCYVLDLPEPAGEGKFVGSMRLWIDEKFLMVLQAEARDGAGHVVRRMFVKSFKKINDRWIIKDLDVQSFPSRDRTTLRVRDVQDVAP